MRTYKEYKILNRDGVFIRFVPVSMNDIYYVKCRDSEDVIKDKMRSILVRELLLNDMPDGNYCLQEVPRSVYISNFISEKV